MILTYDTGQAMRSPTSPLGFPDVKRVHRRRRPERVVADEAHPHNLGTSREGERLAWRVTFAWRAPSWLTGFPTGFSLG